ncbi:MAG: DUF1565 domain-containing protein [Oscillatoriophycideae cyanobacterium NC_groundwater_1537_Pr4_S-0.65um_50_18]|nr:DUF1565 domain-containing protein [Oscillatoriophycideae cyanobacterium NC_groundwater_1537_Pr4_S-0.65um_50_18]
MRLILAYSFQFRFVVSAIALQTLVSLALGWTDSTIAQTVPQPILENGAPSAQLAATQKLLYVNSSTGNDTQADGSESAPFRTITQALAIAQPQTIILLAPGTYSAETGEVFPLVMQPDVTLQGDPTTVGQGFVIQGGGRFLSPTSAGQNIAMLGANQAVLMGVTLTNPNPRGYGLWVESSSPVVLANTFTGNTHDGISTVGSSAPLIQGNVFVRNGANGITIFGNSRPQVQQNVFEETGFGINISENAAPLIQENRISQNRIGILVQEKAQPIIRGNLIEGSQEDGVAAIAQSLPNLGTVAEPGNNTFMRNSRYDINASANRQIISAVGNPMLSDRITGRVDVEGALSGSNAVMVASVADQIPVTPRAAAILINQLPPTQPTRSSQLSSTPQASLVSVRQPSRPSGAIDIPVPLPTGSAPMPARQTSGAAAVSIPAQSAAAIRIPVPLPAQSSRPQTPPHDSTSSPIAQVDLLPVPSEQVPVGNIGDLPTVNVLSDPTGGDRTAFTSRPATPLKYRVLVEADSDRIQKLVQSVVPNAFLIREQGRSLMQIGAFSSRDNAESAVEMLDQNGLRGEIEDFE